MYVSIVSLLYIFDLYLLQLVVFVNLHRCLEILAVFHKLFETGLEKSSRISETLKFRIGWASYITFDVFHSVLHS